MNRRSFLAVAAAAVLLTASAGCEESPTAPGQITEPPPAPAPTPTPSPTPPPPRLGVARVLSFGDSMTEGTTSSPLTGIWFFALDAGRPQSYPFKLQALITARYTDQTIQVFNAGLAGRRASEDIERFDDAVSEAQPEVVLLMEGANDLNAPLDPGEGMNDRINLTVGSLEEMVKNAVRRQTTVLLATLPPQRPGGPKAQAAEFLPRYNDALKVMAGKKGAHIVDVSAQFPLELIGQDGLHPTEEGYQRLADIWLEALKSRYETTPAGGASASRAMEVHAGNAARAPGAPAIPEGH